MNKREKDYGSTFWIHLIMVLIAYLSWTLFSWYYILVGIIIVRLSHFCFNGCIVTIKEFGKETDETTFIGYYLQKWGIIKRNTRKVKWFIRNISPVIIFILAIIWQVLLGLKPLIF